MIPYLPIIATVSVTIVWVVGVIIASAPPASISAITTILDDGGILGSRSGSFFLFVVDHVGETEGDDNKEDGIEIEFHVYNIKG